jgi:Phage protein Gp138 N-terminal domain
VTYNQFRPDEPDLEHVLHAWFEQYLENLHTAFPARVQNYDPVTQTADLVPVIRHAVSMPSGRYTYEDMPVMSMVPIIQPRTAGWFVHLPISAGDFVLVVCCSSNFAYWWIGDGSKAYPGDIRRHDPSFAVGIPGFFNRGRSLQRMQQGNADLASDLVIGQTNGTQIAIQRDGRVLVTQGANVVVQVDPDGTVHLGGAAGDKIALAGSVLTELTKIQTTLASLSGATFGMPYTAPASEDPLGATKAKAT